MGRSNEELEKNQSKNGCGFFFWIVYCPIRDGNVLFYADTEESKKYIQNPNPK